MAEDKIIKDNSKEDLEAMEAFDTAVQLEPKTDVWVCTVCGWMYDPKLGLPAKGIEPGTSFEDLPYDFVCPLCHAPKSDFVMKVEVNPDDGGESITNAQ